MYEYRCRIVKVVDGDTVDVDIDLGFGVWMHNERIRLYGIDTPESRTRDLEEKKYGLLAKEYVLKALPIGSEQILITMKDKTGKFGRILGKFKIVLADIETTLNELMVINHHAVEYHGQSKQEIANKHLANRKLVENQIVYK
jgi:micrococcal nuclease